MHDELRLWEKRGRYLWIRGRRVFCWEHGSGPTILALHGFPASSYDWRLIAEHLDGFRLVALDLPGFGLSDKHPGDDYSLLAQADIVEDAARALGIRECFLLAHDMGDSVAAELLARSNEGSASFRIQKTVLLNGSIFIELAHLTSGQKLFLRLPARRLSFTPPLRPFRRQIRNLFSKEHPASDEEILMLERFLAYDGGARMVPITIRYIEERKERASRWTSGLVDHKEPIALIWGEQDPVAVPEMTDRLLELRPETETVRWHDVGHWPQLEVPERVASEVGRILRPLTTEEGTV
jgi:pimeloyl-ACP methyl ester carboxylesterase